MTATPWTRGPWHVRTGKSGYPASIRATNGDKTKPGGIVDVTRWNAIGLPSSAEGQANARLIAAAPDMAEALVLAEDALSRQSWQWTGAGPHPQEVIGSVRAALVKARGHA